MTPEAKWQPIETAPKDGTAVLLFGGQPDRHSDYTCGYCDDALDLPSKCVVAWWEAYDGALGYWRCGSYDNGVYGEWEDPTHWMPLPEPPQ